tara:strand:+ start:14 stop:217 length:204 start_codon:yes stop_codon:yes gene_type:complete
MDKLAAWISDVSRRSERTLPIGDRSAQTASVMPTEIFGIEANAVIKEIPTSGLVPGSGQARVGEFEI